MTVPGNKRWPMAPERRCQPLAPWVESPPQRNAGHYAFKTTAFGKADGIHIVARREQSRADHVPGFHLFGEVAEFLDAFDGRAVEFLDVAQQRLGEALLFLVVKPKLDGVVAVALLGFALQHAVGAGEHDRHRRDHAFGVIDARLAQFLS